jgi:hypothetical protein
MATSYNSAVAIAASTSATNTARNKGVMIVNNGGGATEADINFTTPGGQASSEVVIKGVANHNPIIIPIRFYKTGGTQTNCTVYELT